MKGKAIRVALSQIRNLPGVSSSYLSRGFIQSAR